MDFEHSSRRYAAIWLGLGLAYAHRTRGLPGYVFPIGAGGTCPFSLGTCTLSSLRPYAWCSPCPFLFAGLLRSTSWVTSSVSDFRFSNFWFSISDVRFSMFNFQILNWYFQNFYFRFPDFDFQLPCVAFPIFDVRSRIFEFRLSVSEFRLSAVLGPS